MFKRLSWMTVGFGLAVWSRRVVRAKVRRYRPAHVSAELGVGVRRFGDELRVAAREGRSAMRQREAELRRGGPIGHR